MTHFLDTNCIRVLEGYYPTRFPSFWKAFNAAVRKGVVASVTEVRKELDRGAAAPHILEWADANPDFFQAPTEPVLAAVRSILDVPKFREMVGEKQIIAGTPVADPFLIGAALVASGTVVTEERYKPNSAKIPTVCNHFNVRCTTLEGMLDDLKWSF